MPDDVQNLLVIGHNPGIQGVAETLTAGAEGDTLERMSRHGFPTSAVAVLRFEGSWKSVEPGTATLTDYWAPHEPPE